MSENNFQRPDLPEGGTKQVTPSIQHMEVVLAPALQQEQFQIPD